MTNVSNTLCWAWHFLLLVESAELSLQPFANTYLISRAGMLSYFSGFIMSIFGGSCDLSHWHCLYAPHLLLFLLPFQRSDPYIYKSIICFFSRVCVVNNTWTWLATNVLCKLNSLPGSFSENQRNDGGRELIWRNLNQHLQEILPPAPPSHLSLNKASKCFRGLKGTL